MDAIQLELEKRSSIFRYFAGVDNEECKEFVKNMYVESKRRICSTLGIVFDNVGLSYETIRIQSGLEEKAFDDLVETNLNSQIAATVKKYYPSFFGVEFEAYGAGLSSDLEIALLDFDGAVTYISNYAIATGGNANTMDYIRLRGNMHFIINGLGLPDDTTKQITSLLETNEAGKFINVLIANNKVHEFFKQLFVTSFVTIPEALQLLVNDNDKVSDAYKVCKADIDGKEYWLYPFF